MKEALGLVRKFHSDDDDENPEKMSKKEFNKKAEVLMKGTTNLRVIFRGVQKKTEKSLTKNLRFKVIIFHPFYLSSFLLF